MTAEAGVRPFAHVTVDELVLVARVAGWSVAIEDNGWQGSRPEVLRVLSAGARVVSVYQNVNAYGRFSYAVDGVVLTGFEPLFPQRRWGSQPDLLLPQMRAVGLDPDWPQPPYGAVDLVALALAERLTGVHLDARALDRPLLAAVVTPRLSDPPASFRLRREDARLAAAIGQAAPALLRRAAATAAGHAVRLAQLESDPVVVEALAAAEAGQARRVGDTSPLGWRIRTWALEAEIAWRVRNDPSASRAAQQASARLLQVSGRGPAPPLKDPAPWLAPERVAALRLRLAAVQALRAALLADPHTAVAATLEHLRYLPAWTAIRAATLGILAPGGTAVPPDATDL